MQRRPLLDRQGGPVCATTNLVAPLATKATATRTTDIADLPKARSRSGAVSSLIGGRLRWSDLDSATLRSTPIPATTPGTSTSTTATRTTGTRTTVFERVPSANQYASVGHVDFSFEELVVAYFDCRRHKRNTASALEFEVELERNLIRLYEELKDGSYKPGPSICFVITRPKPREVWASAFRDRIPHHLLYNRVSPHFYASFIADSCACIPGRGTLYAGQRLEAKVRSITQNWNAPAYYLKCDLANFFVSIDKYILFELLASRIVEPWWRKIAQIILFHDPRRDVVLRSSASKMALIPTHKSLFNQVAGKGLPIGNLSSQFFANVYLNELDQFVKHKIGARHYIRYVDDFVLLHESAQFLNDARRRIELFLDSKLHMRLNPSKTILQPIDRGIDFVGHVIKPWRRTTRKRTVNDAFHRMRSLNDSYLYETANSYFGLFRQASHSMRVRHKLSRLLLLRGKAIDGAFTKTYRGMT